MQITDPTPASSRRFQFGLRTFLLVALALGPILAWVTIKLGLASANAAVSGHVAQDGSPAASVTVVAVAVDHSFTARAITDAQGAFTFKRGLPSGEYLISFDDPAGAVSPRFRTASTSGLTFTVKPGTNVVDFALSQP